jgi:hypothetical protein
MRFLISLLALIFLGACTAKVGGDRSTISLNIPSLQALKASGGAAQKVSTSSIETADVKWENACFMVSVTASDIPSKTGGVCEIPSGVFYGSVAPGASASATKISLEVPKGEGRRVVVYAYFRHSSTEACAIRDNLNGFGRDRVGMLGSLENVSIRKESETLDIDISLPTQMIATSANLPASCSTTARTGATGGRFVSGTQTGQVSANNYIISTSTGGSSKRVLMTTSNGFQVYRKRGISK